MYSTQLQAPVLDADQRLEYFVGWMTAENSVRLVRLIEQFAGRIRRIDVVQGRRGRARRHHERCQSACGGKKQRRLGVRQHPWIVHHGRGRSWHGCHVRIRRYANISATRDNVRTVEKTKLRLSLVEFFLWTATETCATRC